MKKGLLFAMFFAAGICMSFKTYAQSYDRITGKFETSSAHVIYSVSPSVLTDNMVLEMTVTDGELAMKAQIVNESGEKILPISQSSVSGRFGENVNVANLPAGNYYVDIAYGPDYQQHQRIAITKL